MKVLISGFEPFGTRDINISWEVAKCFKDIDPEIDVVRLPVSFQNAHLPVIKLLEVKDYDLVIMLGEASQTDYIRIERLAINYKDSSSPDNDGVRPDDQRLVHSAPDAYFTPVPVKKLSEVLSNEGFKQKVSNSAGTYVCNSLYFNILHHQRLNNLSCRTLFLHVPRSTETLSLNEMGHTVERIIQILRDKQF